MIEILKFIADKTFLLIFGFLFFFAFLFLIFNQDPVTSRIKYALSNVFYHPSYLQAGENWQTYSLSNITFQAPDDFKVTLTYKYQAKIEAPTKWSDTTIWLDSGIYRHLKSYEDAIKYYKFDKKIRVFDLKELGQNKVYLRGQEYDPGPFKLGEWSDFKHMLVKVNDKAVLLNVAELSSYHAFDPKTLERIADSIKPLN